MTISQELEKKTPVNKSEEKSLQEKLIEEKKALAGVPARPQFGNSRNPMFNKPWFGGKPGGGRPVIRKHAARSR